jgi:hypothetical protein
LLVVAAVAAGRVGLAANDDPSDAAKQAARAKLAEGVELMKQGDAAAALARFQEAYGMVPSPKILFDVGLAQQALGHKAEALAAYQRFVAEVPDPNPASRTKAEQEIAALQQQLAAVSVTCALAGAAIEVDGTAAGAAPLARPVYLEPGEHTIRASAGAKSATQKIDAHAGDQLAVTLDLVEASAAALAPAPIGITPPAPALVTSPPAGTPLIEAQSTPAAKRPLYRRPWFWGVVAGGAVAVGVLTVLLAGQSPSYPTATMGTVRAN